MTFPRQRSVEVSFMLAHLMVVCMPLMQLQGRRAGSPTRIVLLPHPGLSIPHLPSPEADIGNLRWVTDPIRAYEVDSPLVANGVLYVYSTNGSLYALKPTLAGCSGPLPLRQANSSARQPWRMGCSTLPQRIAMARCMLITCHNTFFLSNNA
jgi:PQQ-like domain